MSSFTYRVKSVDLDMGLLFVEIEMKDGSWQELPIDIYSIATSDEDTVEQLEAAIASVIRHYYDTLYPAPIPKPQALHQLVNREYEAA